jgi:hypothetical protein
VSRNYSNLAGGMTLTANCGAASTTLTLDAVTGLPASTPYTLVLDVGETTEEVVTVTNIVGLTVTVLRGADGTTAASHTAGTVVRHMASARDFREPAQHIDATSAVHGVAGSVVGTTDTQGLSNKSIALGSNTITGTKAQFNTALTDGDFASQAGTETLTNKTVNLTSNTLTGTKAQFNTALSDGDFATQAGTETLTNKTLDGATNTFSAIPQASVTSLVANLATLTAADTALDGRVDTLETTATNTAGYTTATGFDTPDTYLRQRGPWAFQVDLRVTRDGATITPNSNGNIADTLMQTINAPCQPTNRSVFGIGSYKSGGGTAYPCNIRMDTDGKIYLTGLTPGIDMANNSDISATICFLI